MTRYLNLDFDFLDHPKVTNLERVLGKDSALCLIRLWCYCGKYHPDDGLMKGMSTDDVERRSGWRGKPGRLIAVMRELGFIEGEEGNFKIHDWEDHQGHLKSLRERGKKAAKARWDKLKGGEQSCLSIANAMQKHSLSNATTGMVKKEEEGGCKGEETNLAPDGSRLAQVWRFHLRRPPTRHDDLDSLADFFGELLRQGHVFQFLETEIKSVNRDRTEATWDFKKRIDKKQSLNGDVPKETPDETNARLREIKERNDRRLKNLGIY